MNAPTPHVKDTVAVLFGGRSSEHEISLRSALFILKNIPEKYQIIPVGISREGVMRSLPGTFTRHHFQNAIEQDLTAIIEGKTSQKFNNLSPILSTILPTRLEALNKESIFTAEFRILNFETDCIFPVLHGTNGEDGRLQGLLEMAEITYVGCDIRASVVGMDKDIQKRLAREAGIPVARYECIESEEFQQNFDTIIKRVESQLGYPCFVKPNSQGSAVGTGKVKSASDLKKALQEAFAFDQKVLVEELLVGTEVECAFLGTSTNPKITEAGEIAPKEFYSYEEKYGANSEAQLHIPARLSKERMNELKTLCAKIAKIMGIYGFSRIDFWNVTNSNKFIFNEFNTIPGLTSISMFPKLWEHSGVLGETWIEELIQRAHQRKSIQDRTQFGIKAQI
jgi:D-alanine-D-alanine ligase